ncbi:MAG: primosomal protein N', partial [Cyanobacteria bacterium K_DeepCast_35m_m2_023]|nr:primosomal protein N' [Cyanobacteria bacterium K_DeepCast_35m_m2_023]
MGTDPLAAPPRWLQVWLEAGREGQTFTYANPLRLPLAPGDLVQVQLRGRRQSGLVVEQLSALPADLIGRQLQPIDKLLQPAAVMPQWQQLIDQVAEACHTSRFQTLKSALPAAWLGQRRQPPAAGQRPSWQIVANPVDLKTERLTERQQALLMALHQAGGVLPLAELCGPAGQSRAVLAGLERRGLVQRRLTSAAPVDGQPPRQLSADQARVLASITAADPGQSLLLWGVTGAGKTEVYLQAAAQALQKGQSVLLLCPEIGLIPQLLDRARSRFGCAVCEYHSGLGDGERVSSWRSALDAQTPQLVVGTRSAVFLPLARLGLIVLDEEHDSSYKQESPMPCYHARDAARLRARREGAVLLLGTATPSIESWHSVQQGQTQLLRLTTRIGARPMPPVRLVDMRQELAAGHRRLISRPLLQRLQRLVGSGEQAVVLVPRRGYRSFLSCRSCGTAVLCPNCDVALTVHRHHGGSEWLRCHWCDHRQGVSSRCGSCGSTAFKPFGAGTQRVIEQLAEELPNLRLLRFDRDSTRGRDGHRQVLSRFAAGEADVLVGTQMLAKGMDLPRVTLAAVLAADGLLFRPDLRSAEQCLQLLLQLAGRAGRGELPGEVLVQTYSPDHPVIQHLVSGDYGAFLAEELAQRRSGAQVPFARAALLRLSGPAASTTATAAAALAERLAPAVHAAGWCLIGPAPAPVARVAGRSRWQL